MNRSILLLIFVLLTSLCDFSAYADYRDSFYKMRAEDSTLSAKERLDAMDNLIKSHPNDWHYLTKKAKLAHSLDEDMVAESALKILTDCHLQDIDLSERCEILDIYSIQLVLIGDYAEAIKVSNILLSENKPDSLIYRDANAYVTQSSAYRHLHNYGLADAQIAKAREIFNEIDKFPVSEETKVLTKLTYWKGETVLAIDKKEFNDAIKCLDKMLNIEHINRAQKAEIYQLYAFCYKKMGDLKVAKEIYDKCFREFDVEYSMMFHDVIKSYLDILIEMKDYIGALDIINRYQSQLDRSVMNKAYVAILRNKSKALAELGIGQEAYVTLARAFEINDTLTEINQQAARDLAQSEYESVVKDCEAEKSANAKTNMLLIILVMVLIILIIVILVICHRLKQQKKKISDIGNRDSADLTNLKAQVEKLESEYEKYKRILVAANVKLQNYAARIDKLNTILSTVKTTDEIKVKSAQEVLADTLNNEEPMNLLISSFESLHPLFFTRVRAAFPNITNAELRLCAFIMLNLSTREIATTMNRSQRTIESLKYRLHQKFNLPARDSLESYIHRTFN
jgi:tetratricopeptide (TPR) repeat protein/DNA-binding CsgD family transcriptional regulator